MRTFEYRDATSDKFWTIDLQGASFTVTWGRRGSTGQTQTKTFADAERAQREHDKLVAEKLGKGYKETTPDAAPAVGAPKPTPLSNALEQALFESPDDLAAHMAYGDHLNEVGDPRGEFIQVQLALEDPERPAAERKALQRREKELLRQHRGVWLGALARFMSGQDFRFARGWLDALSINLTYEKGEKLVAAAAAEPRCRLLRRLAITDVYSTFASDDEEEEVAEGPDPLAALAASPYMGNVRQFYLGEEEGFGEDEHDAEYYNASWELYTAGPGAAWKLIKNMPRLEELYLHCDTRRLKDLLAAPTLGNLRVLQIYLSAEYRDMPALAKNRAVTKLTHLSLKPRAAEEGGAALLRLADVRPLLAPDVLPALTHLRLQNSDLGDEGCQAIVESGILRRLKFLDLARGTITDAGAERLAACPDLKNLDVLDVSCNALTRAGVRRLTQAGVDVLADDQHRANDRSFLYEGEME
jgi:uncharacterized protein (TIGR02996 family)